MGKIKELKEKRAEVFKQMEGLKKQTDGRDMTPEEQTKWDALMREYDKVHERVSQEEQFMEVERRQVSTSIETHGGKVVDSQIEEEYRGAFTNFLKFGSSGIEAKDVEVIKKRTGVQGLEAPVLVPKTLESKIEVALKSFGGMFEAGTVFSTANGGDLIIPTINDTNSRAAIVGEYVKSTIGTKAFGTVTMKAYTYRADIIPISVELLQDSAFDLESLISDLMSSSFYRGVNADLTNGSGTDEPEGIVVAAHQSNATPSATAIKLDDLLDLMKGVDSAYAKNAKFMFNTNTLFALRKLKNTNGDYVWQDTVAGVNPTIFGKPYIINDDMDDIGTGKASVLYGDLSKFRIRIVRDFKVIRLNENLMEYLAIGIMGFARCDGKLIDAGAHPVHKLVHA